MHKSPQAASIAGAWAVQEAQSASHLNFDVASRLASSTNSEGESWVVARQAFPLTPVPAPFVDQLPATIWVCEPQLDPPPAVRGTRRGMAARLARELDAGVRARSISRCKAARKALGRSVLKHAASGQYPHSITESREL
jgi:hypothetical protein